MRRTRAAAVIAIAALVLSGGTCESKDGDPVRWSPVALAGAPSARAGHSAVWTGTRMIVWGGSSGLNTGGVYDPATGAWSATATSGAPAARNRHTAVWTGSEMIVWGGWASGFFENTGGRYNPGTNSWTATSTLGAPDGRYRHTAVWTGTEMIV